MLRAMLGRKSGTQVVDTPEKLAQALGAGYESNAGQRVTTTSACSNWLYSTAFGCWPSQWGCCLVGYLSRLVEFDCPQRHIGSTHSLLWRQIAT